MVTADEGIRFDSSLEKLAGLKTVSEGGVVTAGNASPCGARHLQMKGVAHVGVWSSLDGRALNGRGQNSPCVMNSNSLNSRLALVEP